MLGSSDGEEEPLGLNGIELGLSDGSEQSLGSIVRSVEGFELLSVEANLSIVVFCFPSDVPLGLVLLPFS